MPYLHITLRRSRSRDAGDGARESRESRDVQRASRGARELARRIQRRSRENPERAREQQMRDCALHNVLGGSFFPWMKLIVAPNTNIYCFFCLGLLHNLGPKTPPHPACPVWQLCCRPPLGLPHTWYVLHQAYVSLTDHFLSHFHCFEGGGSGIMGQK